MKKILKEEIETSTRKKLLGEVDPSLIVAVYGCTWHVIEKGIGIREHIRDSLIDLTVKNYIIDLDIIDLDDIKKDSTLPIEITTEI